MLDDWSKGKSLGIEEVVDLPEALAREIVRTAPSSTPRPQDYAKSIPEVGTEHSVAATDPPMLQIPQSLQWKSGPYAHQGEAVKAWEEGDVGERGVIAMATGAGKTIDRAYLCGQKPATAW